MLAPRAHIRDLFLRLLGVVFLIAFTSLLVQVDVLIGSRGLLPAERVARAGIPFLALPTLFRFDAGDAALHAAAVAGIVLSIGLVLRVAPRWCLVGLWALYLSFVNVGQDFLAFQWDNLLLESATVALLVAPGGVRPRRAPSPHPIATALVLWLAFRLHVESGLAKLFLGDPTWRDLTAMVSYYETAPLPTWVGWYAHQMPLRAHRAAGALMYVVELLVPLFFWTSHRLRGAAFLAAAGMQVVILLTANYGFFNYLSLVLLVFVLDDRHVAWIAARLGRRLPDAPPRTPSPAATAALAVVAPVVVGLSLVAFLPFVPGLQSLNRSLLPVRRAMNAVRSVNAYHLFAQMTLVRREAVIEGSADGDTWLPYEFRYKPGDPDRPPPFVAPHQPRVDFLLWFLLLGNRTGAPYFTTLLDKLLTEPDVVAPLFTTNPFPDAPPRQVRVAIHRYRFTDAATRRTTNAWWHRDLETHTRPLDAEALRRGR